MIPIARPQMGEEEKELVWSTLASGQLAQGERVREFEERFAAFVGAPHAVATSSGTTALHLIMLGLAIGPGDEVITPSFTFIASASAIVHAGARPVFADIDSESYTLDPERIEAAITSNTRAIMPVSLYGQPADMPAIIDIAQRRNLAVVEDACQAHGAALDGRRSGAWGVGAFSFYPTKNMTTGEGGAITTDDTGLADRVRLLREHGMRQRYHHEIVGYNFRMTDVHASIGLAQLEKLPAANRRRREIASRYSAELRGVGIPRVSRGAEHAYHQYVIRVQERDEFLDRLRRRGVGAAVHYPIPVHRQEAFASMGYRDVSLPVTERLSEMVLSLPIYPGLTDAEVDTVIRATNETAVELGMAPGDASRRP